METVLDIVNRIEEQLAGIVKSIGKPLKEAGNNYRQVAESICKAVISGRGGVPSGMLDKLISDATKSLETVESSRDVGVFKSEIRYLQNIGNTYSHDESSSGAFDLEGQSRAFESLVKVIRVAFFCEADIEAPKLPKEIEEKIPSRMVGRCKFENPRSEEVVKLCFSRQKVETKSTKSDRSSRVVYDYVVVDLGDGLTKGILFFRSRTSIEKALLDFWGEFESDFPSALVVVTPRAYRIDGKEIDRKKSIQDILKSTPLNQKNRSINVSYFDDFVWDYCLPDEFRADAPSRKKLSHFVPQTLDQILGEGLRGEHFGTKDYVSKLLTSTNDYSPVQVVIGPAGIGKTTFCDEIASYINEQNKKRVVLISATDFRDVSNSAPIESVSDLYRVAMDHDLIDEMRLIESHNFEINLACGNLVLLIDGFDELESHLGDSLNFEKFMHSLSDLEECFRKVLVVLTVRDYDEGRFSGFGQVTISRLSGFTEDDTDKYLRSRLIDSALIKRAKSILDSFEDLSSGTTIPLYASLICDYLIDEGCIEKIETGLSIESAKYFFGNQSLDSLVKTIVGREIAKQSLGNIGPDDFFEILIEIIRSPQASISKSALLDYVSACGGDEKLVSPQNFLRNPFLRWERNAISFRYDSLVCFFKARFLARRVLDGNFSPLPSIEFMAEFCRGDGALHDEICEILPPADFAESDGALNWFNGLLKYGLGDGGQKAPWRKAVSAFMYWALAGERGGSERSRRLCKYYGLDAWRGFSVFGKFFPVDFSDVCVLDGHIDNYTSLPLCKFADSKPVFFGTHVEFDEKSLPAKLDRSIFGDGCTFSDNLSKSFDAKDKADESSSEIVVENLYKILKVGFRGNRFVWKSKDVYRNVTVVGRHSLVDYLNHLSASGPLSIQPSKNNSEFGYIVSDEWYHDARKLVEEKNLTKKMAGIVSSLKG